ncbi:family 20 glycosylhydrolase [Roseateles sp.]|uniref:family 20 glycosylhydrolase n=1 Tax=Roseateles sp. TaxID=1971397 RepID=UPI0025E7F0BC|nr:family 20 glycosylhydrolase [Roseateles sp.]MBV8035297.1 family 20 glycosylhydrolase [Roseateles sp.]
MSLDEIAAALLPQPQSLTPLPGRGPAVPRDESEGREWLALPRLAPRLPQLGDDESFRLHLTAGSMSLQAETPAGVSHGLQALSQLWHAAREAGLRELPALQIDDAPRHPWRGLLVDVARRPLPFDAMLGLLDGMAAARLNVFHWHLTDDQAWRLESRRFPALHERASGGFFYTLDQARRLVAEAAARGIRVVPELDLPGHCWALGLACPELLCAPAPTEVQPAFGVFGAAVNPDSEALYAFLDGLFSEWAEVFPDPFLHLGGDELAPAAWAALAEQRGGSLAELQAAYLARIGELLRRHDRRLVAWDEMGQSSALPPGSLLQCWRGDEALRLAPPGLAGRLRSAGFYLDQIHPAAYHWRRSMRPPTRPAAPAEGAEAWSLQARVGAWQVEGRLWLGSGAARLHLRSTGTLDEWLAPRVVAGQGVWRLQVDSDLGELELWGPDRSGRGWLRLGALRQPCDWLPLRAGAPAWPAEEPARPTPMLGGEAALWAELVEAPQLALRCWPRALAVAERLWSDPADERQLDQRLAAAQRWLMVTGRVPADPAAPLFARLCPDAAERANLRALAQWLEPGSGYARQHAKKSAQTYHQGEALDRLADALPAQSPLIPALRDDAAAWQSALGEARDRLPAWRALLSAAPRLVPVLPLLDVLADLFELGLALWAGRVPANAQQRLHDAAALVDEMLPALVQPLQHRLDALA